MKDLHLDPIRQVRIAKLWAFAGIAWAIVFPLLVYALTLNPSGVEIAFVLVPAAAVSFGAVELAARWEARTHRRYAYPHRLGYELANIHEFDTACGRAAISICEWLDLSYVAIGVLSDDEDKVTPIAAQGMPGDWLSHAQTVSSDLMGRNPDSGEWRMLRRQAVDDPWATDEPGVMTATVPLVSLNRALGVLTIAARRGNPQLGDDRLLEAMGMVLALALDNCRLYEGQRANAGYFESLHRMKSDFLNTVSHELRTPLTSILLAAEMLMEEQGPDERSGAHNRMVQSIIKGAMRMRSMVEDLLSVSRQDEMQPRLEPEAVSLSDLVNNAVQIVQPLVAAKRQTLEVSMDDEDTLVMADRLRFEQVLINLLSNAQRYSPPGGRVEVSAKRGSGNEILITVTDSGPGVSLEHAKHIFEPFFRGDRSGLGLGLAIAKSIVDLHKGRIWVEPAPRYGSRFCVALRGSLPSRLRSDSSRPTKSSPTAEHQHV